MNDSKTEGERLDLRGVPCPMNSARTLVQLETMDTGEILEVLLDDGEPVENVPDSIDEAFYEIIDQKKIDDRDWRIRIKVL